MGSGPITFATGSSQVWGAETSMLNLAAGLQVIGEQVDLISAASALSSHWDSSGLRRTTLPLRWTGRAGKYLSIIRAIRDLPQDARIVLFDLRLLPLAISARLTCPRKHLALFVDLHDSAAHSRRRRVLFQLMRLVNGVVCVSEYIRSQVPSTVPSSVVWRGVATDDSSFDDAPRAVAIVGQIEPAKDVPFGLQALARTPSDWTVIVRGDGSDPHYVSECRQLAQQLLPERLRWEGRVPQDSALNGASVLMFMNADEPSGRVIAEAQARGVIPVVPDAGGAAEFVQHGRTGWTYAAGDLASAAKVLAEALNVSAVTSMRSGARSHARAAYDPLTQAARYRDQLSGGGRLTSRGFPTKEGNK